MTVKKNKKDTRKFNRGKKITGKYVGGFLKFGKGKATKAAEKVKAAEAAEKVKAAKNLSNLHKTIYHPGTLAALKLTENSSSQEKKKELFTANNIKKAHKNFLTKTNNEKNKALIAAFGDPSKSTETGMNLNTKKKKNLC
jgi:hypothetical protein